MDNTTFRPSTNLYTDVTCFRYYFSILLVIMKHNLPNVLLLNLTFLLSSYLLRECKLLLLACKSLARGVWHCCCHTLTTATRASLTRESPTLCNQPMPCIAHFALLVNHSIQTDGTNRLLFLFFYRKRSSFWAIFGLTICIPQVCIPAMQPALKDFLFLLD